MAEEQAEDISNWNLFVEGVRLDLTGSTISLDVTTQVAAITLGSQANLHANFQLGVSTGPNYAGNASVTFDLDNVRRNAAG